MLPETLLAILVALLVGSGYPMQAGINATIAQYHGHPLLAALTNTTVASLVLVVRPERRLVPQTRNPYDYATV